MYRASRGCKGIGRLLWLKCFESVEIDSCYMDIDGVKQYRHFVFTPKGITTIEKTNTNDGKIGTKVTLKGIAKIYKEAVNRLTQESIAKSLFEHCLWFFLREGSSPNIRISDGDTPATNLNEIYEHYLYSDKSNSCNFNIGEVSFNVLHVRLQRLDNNNYISYCAGSRIVKDEK